ncbi:3-oxoacid CoA-transferase subunit B [Bradyrhizobium sp. 153]|nr:3-oxoacid CoA-transferase subunit B [Bradyrhizobium sp. 153]MCK1667706.1 3-oxoacid CoA-transferase subunit B [Bradyrhizobium sp. 153]
MVRRLSREEIASRIARELRDGSFVNLGIGLPTLVADRIPEGIEVVLHSENGILNIGPRPPAGEEDWDLVNAGKDPISLLRGGSFFDSSLSFIMMRGGHLDCSILGAYQVSDKGDLANWSMGAGDDLPGVGGAMDLAVGAREIWVMMEHVTKQGAPRIVSECTLPLTALGVVTRIFTDLAVLDVTSRGLRLREIVEGLDAQSLQELTAAPIALEGKQRPLHP